MTEDETQTRTAEVLKLRYVEGLSIRAIARRLQMARKTVSAIVSTRKATVREAALGLPSWLSTTW